MIPAMCCLLQHPPGDARWNIEVQSVPNVWPQLFSTGGAGGDGGRLGSSETTNICKQPVFRHHWMFVRMEFWLHRVCNHHCQWGRSRYIFVCLVSRLLYNVRVMVPAAVRITVFSSQNFGEIITIITKIKKKSKGGWQIKLLITYLLITYLLHAAESFLRS